MASLILAVDASKDESHKQQGVLDETLRARGLHDLREDLKEIRIRAAPLVS